MRMRLREVIAVSEAAEVAVSTSDSSSMITKNQSLPEKPEDVGAATAMPRKFGQLSLSIQTSLPLFLPGGGRGCRIPAGASRIPFRGMRCRGNSDVTCFGEASAYIRA